MSNNVILGKVYRHFINRQEDLNGMNKDEKFTIEGKIIKHNPGGRFCVKIQTEKDPYIIKDAYVCGKIKMNSIRLVVGDTVLVEIDCNDFKGRILERL